MRKKINWDNVIHSWMNLNFNLTVVGVIFFMIGFIYFLFSNHNDQAKYFLASIFLGFAFIIPFAITLLYFIFKNLFNKFFGIYISNIVKEFKK